MRRALERFLGALDQDQPYVVAAAEALAQASHSEEVRERLGDANREFRELVATSLRPAAGSAVSDRELTALASTLVALFDGLAIQHLIDPAGVPDAAEVMQSLARVADRAATEQKAGR